MPRILHRFVGRLNNRLLLTHMLVALTVLAIAGLMLLALQAPIRSDIMLRRMGDWLSPAIAATRGGMLGAMASGSRRDALRQQFLDYLHSQADAQNGRILIVDHLTETVIYDTEAELPGASWQPETTEPFVFGRGRMRPGMMLAPMDTLRGSTHVAGKEWLYVSSPLVRQDRGGLDLVLLKARPSFWTTIDDALNEMPVGLLIVTVIVLVAVIFLLSRWTAEAVTRGIAPLIAATEALADGELSHRVNPESASLEEVRVLATSFNQMADRVQNSQQAQRDFIANVSHDLKTPLTSIQGYSHALVDGTAASADAQRHAAVVIGQEAQRLAGLVEEIIDLARLEEGKLRLHAQTIDLNDLLSTMAEVYLLRAEAMGVVLHWQTCPAPIKVFVDEDRMQRALANLVDNALTYSQFGGEVHVSITTPRQDAENAKYVEVSVSDTGPGVPKEEQARIFERFYRLDKARTGARGAGLGLAIVKEIVEAHGGAVGVENREGGGSRFWLRIPMS